MKPPVNQPRNPLFTNGENWEMNACVGDNGGPYDLFDYGKGFFEGGHAIVKAAQDHIAPVDILVYPAAFAYRHAIELLLKQLISSFQLILGSEGKGKKDHKIADLWASAFTLSAKIETRLIGDEDVLRAGELIMSFDEFDPTGQVFRYPEDIKGNRHLSDYKLINVEVLCDHMKELQGILERWCYQASDFRDRPIEGFG